MTYTLRHTDPYLAQIKTAPPLKGVNPIPLVDATLPLYKPLLFSLTQRDHLARLDPNFPEYFMNAGLSFRIHPIVPEPGACGGLVKIHFYDLFNPGSYCMLSSDSRWLNLPYSRSPFVFV